MDVDGEAADASVDGEGEREPPDDLPRKNVLERSRNALIEQLYADNLKSFADSFQHDLKSDVIKGSMALHYDLLRSNFATKIDRNLLPLIESYFEKNIRLVEPGMPTKQVKKLVKRGEHARLSPRTGP